MTPARWNPRLEQWEPLEYEPQSDDRAPQVRKNLTRPLVYIPHASTWRTEQTNARRARITEIILTLAALAVLAAPMFSIFGD